MGTGPSPVRVGVLLGSKQVPAWAARTLCDLLAEDGVELVVLCAPQPAPAKSGLYSVYERLDRQLFGVADDAEAPVEVETLLGDKQVADPEMLADANLDVLLLIGVRSLEARTLECARHGVWVWDHDHLETAPFFRDLSAGEAVTETRLRRLDASGEPGPVLYASTGAINPSSLARTKSRALWKSAEFPLRVLRAARRSGWGALPELAREMPEPSTPSNAAVLALFASLTARFVRNRVSERFERAEWFVALRRRRDGEPAAMEPMDFAPVSSPKGRWYADPFLFSEGDAHWLFVEEFDELGLRKGFISVAPVSEDGAVGEMQKVLERDYHLSYPFVFRFEDELYLMPETGRNRCVELYRAVDFPQQWTLDRVLLSDCVAVDPTLFEHDGTFWLFVNQAREGAAIDDELHLYFADSPFGPWNAHPQNPVVSDVCRARPAGRLFRHGTDIIRPSQDSSVRYGYALTFNRVDMLTRDDYRETPIRRIEPTWVPDGAGRATHTYNRDDTFEVIDAQVLRRR